mmetsp:Transcript_2590/g.2700  ORF Transcript_2590/g.2700 Transcript_2590/m.2700 type:complete len:477 (-) Transcript_2590:280-1710(-)
MSLLDVEPDSSLSTAEGSRVNAITLCMVCESSQRQYKCPRCDYFTCSLKCCKQHKLETECNGKRDRTAFISVQDFQEKNLRSDFHFLEDILQTKDSAVRTLNLNCGGKGNDSNYNNSNSRNRRNPSTSSTSLTSSSNSFGNLLATPIQQLHAYPATIKRLAKAAASHDVALVLMPLGMSKRLLNTTHYRPKSDLILWRLHMVFIINNSYQPPMLLRPEGHNSNGQGQGDTANFSTISITEDALLSMSLPTTEESRSISNILEEFLDPRPGNSVQRHALRSLRVCREQGALRCLIQQLPSPGGDPVFCEVPLDFTLKTVLEGKTVIEYPTLFIGSLENTMKLKMRVADVSVSERERSVEGEVGDLDGQIKDEEKGQVDATTLEEETQAIGISESNTEGLLSVSNGKRNIRDVNGEEKSVSKVQIVCPHTSDDKIEDEVDEGGDDDGDDEGDDVFFKALKEFEGKDIDALKAFIASSE